MTDVACSGGVVHREGRPFGCYFTNTMPPSAIAWYEREWRILVRRLQYRGSSKAVKARKRILLHWGPDALDQAYEEAFSR